MVRIHWATGHELPTLLLQIISAKIPCVHTQNCVFVMPFQNDVAGKVEKVGLWPTPSGEAHQAVNEPAKQALPMPQRVHERETRLQ